MSHPKRVDRFRQWSKDMIEGATVDRPRLTTTGRKKKPVTNRKRRNRRKKQQRHGSKD